MRCGICGKDCGAAFIITELREIMCRECQTKIHDGLESWMDRHPEKYGEPKESE